MWYEKALASGQILGLQQLALKKRIASAEPPPESAAVLLAHVVAARRFTLISAQWGSGGRKVSVVKEIQAGLHADPFAPIHASTGAFGDPAYDSHKNLHITYRADGTLCSCDVDELNVGIVPEIPQEGLAIAGASTSFTIIAARYGVDRHWIDCTDAIRKEVKDPQEPFKVHNMAPNNRDMHPGVDKYLVVYYELHGKLFVRIQNSKYDPMITIIPK